MSTADTRVEARQLTPENGAELWEWADSKPHYDAYGNVDGLTIWTPLGRMKADFGDWIVRIPPGTFWPVKIDADKPAVLGLPVAASDEPDWPDTGGCTEWTCRYHGEINRARAEHERAGEATR